ncbi:GNAT family N-acetyltransferase [bacterium]|nr:MAG: GNAT family N-acetyltransferase [bacterium]
MKTIIKLVDKEDSEEIQAWENFLLENNEGNILQSSLMGKVFGSCGFDWNLVVAKQNESIVGGAISTIWPGEKFRFLSKFSTFKTTYGPIVGTKKGKEEIALRILKKIEEIISKRGAIKHIILSKDDWMQKEIEGLGYKINPYIVGCTFLIDLHKSEEELWKALRKTVRPSINKARKYGVEIKEGKNQNAPLIMHNLHSENYRRVKMSPNPLSFHKSMWEILEKKGHAKFFFAYYEGKPVAGLVVLVDRRTIYAYSGGSLKEGLKLEANKLLHWHVIQWGAERDYEFYDLLFAPSGKYRKNPSWGIYLFKKDLGGSEIPVFYYEKEYSKKRILFWSKVLVPIYNKIELRSKGF